MNESRWGVSTVKDGMREGMTSVKEGIKGLAEDMKELVLGNQRTNSFVSIASWYVCMCVCRDLSVWHDSFVCHDSVVPCDMTRLPGNQSYSVTWLIHSETSARTRLLSVLPPGISAYVCAVTRSCDTSHSRAKQRTNSFVSICSWFVACVCAVAQQLGNQRTNLCVSAAP